MNALYRFNELADDHKDYAVEEFIKNNDDDWTWGEAYYHLEEFNDELYYQYNGKLEIDTRQDIIPTTFMTQRILAYLIWHRIDRNEECKRLCSIAEKYNTTKVNTEKENNILMLEQIDQLIKELGGI